MILNGITLIQGLPHGWFLIDLCLCLYIVYLLTAKNIAVVSYTISLSLFQYEHFLIKFDEKIAFEHTYILFKLPGTYNVIELT